MWVNDGGGSSKGGVSEIFERMGEVMGDTLSQIALDAEPGSAVHDFVERHHAEEPADVKHVDCGKLPDHIMRSVKDSGVEL